MARIVRFISDKVVFTAERIGHTHYPYNHLPISKYKYRNHGLFVGFAPRVEPQIAVSVIAEHGCHGSTAAAPVARAVITTYMKKYFPELRKKYIAEERKEFLREKKRIEREKQKQKQKQKKAMSIAV